MDNDENTDPSVSTPRLKRQRLEDVDLEPSRKKLCKDPFIHHGRHFVRTVDAFCQISALVGHGALSDDTHTDRRHRVLKQLLQMIPGLEARLANGSYKVIDCIAGLIQKGCTGARSDDIKSLKGAVLDWIVPRGEPLVPLLARNVKSDRGFHHDRTGALLCPAGLDWSNAETKERLRSSQIGAFGDQWPIFIYHEYVYNPKEPWDGLFRGRILVSAYKHIFTSPSSAEAKPRSTRSGNAQIHGMTKVTPASIAYVTTQVQFALSSLTVFSKREFERFYNTIMELFDDVEEQKEVEDLLAWWNVQIFPEQPTFKHNRLLDRIKEKRIELRAADNNLNIE